MAGTHCDSTSSKVFVAKGESRHLNMKLVCQEDFPKNPRSLIGCKIFWTDWDGMNGSPCRVRYRAPYGAKNGNPDSFETIVTQLARTFVLLEVLSQENIEGSNYIFAHSEVPKVEFTKLHCKLLCTVNGGNICVR